MKPLKLILLVLILSSCSSHTPVEMNRIPQSEKIKYPTSKELFLEGTFNVKPAKKNYENHFGEELDLSERRPVVDLAETIFEKKYFSPNTHLIANFYHAGKFYIARINKEAVENVFFQISFFPPVVMKKYIAAHTLFRVETRSDMPVELVAVMPDKAKLESLRGLSEEEALAKLPEPTSIIIKNFGISAEAQWAKNDPKKAYDLMRGKKGAFIQIIRFVSMEERYIQFFKSGNPVTQIYLPQEDKDLNNIVAAGIKRSQSDGISYVYDTLFNNCTTTAFDILESGLNVKDERFSSIRRTIEKRVPTLSDSKIKSYGGGMEVSPMQIDSSMMPEMKAAYEKIVKIPKRALCTKDMPESNCAHLKRAQMVLKSQGMD